MIFLSATACWVFPSRRMDVAIDGALRDMWGKKTSTFSTLKHACVMSRFFCISLVLPSMSISYAALFLG